MTKSNEKAINRLSKIIRIRDVMRSCATRPHDIKTSTTTELKRQPAEA